jgi:hypothetical protein
VLLRIKFLLFKFHNFSKIRFLNKEISRTHKNKARFREKTSLKHRFRVVQNNPVILDLSIPLTLIVATPPSSLACFVEGMEDDISFSKKSKIDALGIGTDDGFGDCFIFHTCLFTR